MSEAMARSKGQYMYFILFLEVESVHLLFNINPSSRGISFLAMYSYAAKKLRLNDFTLSTSFVLVLSYGVYRHDVDF